MRKALLLLAALALLMLAGCSKTPAAPPAEGSPAPAEGTPAPDATTAPTGEETAAPETATPANPASSVHDALLAYKSVLKSNDALEDFLAETAESGKILTPSRFALIDLDNDGMPEVVIELSDEYPYFYEVLHYENGNMYGQVFAIREFNDLKADGIFSWAAGAGESGYSRLHFDGTMFVTESIAYTTAERDGADVTQLYFLNDKPVTQEEYEAFTAEQVAKPAAPWNDYTTEHIEEVLTPEA